MDLVKQSAMEVYIALPSGFTCVATRTLTP